jgi:hypothetical protein
MKATKNDFDVGDVVACKGLDEVLHRLPLVLYPFQIDRLDPIRTLDDYRLRAHANIPLNEMFLR